MTDQMLMMPQPAVRTRFSDWPFAVKSILGFWFFYALTVIVRAFLGTDPLTTLEDKLVVIAVGIVITGFIYLSITTFGQGANIRRRAIIAAISSAIASVVMGGALVLTEDLLPQSKEQFRFQAREGFTVVEQGNQVRIERTAQEPLVLTMPGVHELDPMKRLRYARHRPKPWALSGGWRTRRARPRQPRSARCGTRSIRTSCSTH
jgi:two-component system LytT family sensor kinase